MTTYTAIANTEIDPESPVTSDLMTKLRDNPIAMAEGASGAPTMEVAWHHLETLQPGSDATTQTFATDFTGYRAAKLMGKFGLSSAAAINLQYYAGSWATVLTIPSGSTGGDFAFEIQNIDVGDDATNYLVTAFGMYDNGSASGVVLNTLTGSTPITGFRLTSTNNLTSAGTRCSAYAVKRTQA